jgi:hypothetical protein
VAGVEPITGRPVDRPRRKLRAFITGWNDRAYQFVWTKTADEILAKANRQTTSATDH